MVNRCPEDAGISEEYVVIGTRDILIGPELSRRLALGILGSATVEIDAAHMTIWEQPDAWVAAVSGWLGG